MQLFAEQFTEILRALGDARTPKRRGEKRTFFRVGARYRLSARFGATAPVDAWLRDVSSSGVGILLPQPTPPQPGATMTLDLSRKDGSSVCVACVVRNTVQVSPGTHQVGASFVLPIEQVRAALGMTRPIAKSA